MRSVVITVLIRMDSSLPEHTVVNVIGVMPLYFNMSEQFISEQPLVREEFSCHQHRQAAQLAHVG